MTIIIISNQISVIYHIESLVHFRLPDPGLSTGGPVDSINYVN